MTAAVGVMETVPMADLRIASRGEGVGRCQSRLNVAPPSEVKCAEVKLTHLAFSDQGERRGPVPPPFRGELTGVCRNALGAALLGTERESYS